MPAHLMRFTSLNLTKTQLKVLLALQKHLHIGDAAEALGMSLNSIATTLTPMRSTFGVKTTWGCVVIFDRWSDANYEELARVRQSLGI